MKETYNEFLMNESLIKWLDKIPIKLNITKKYDKLEQLVSLILHGIQLPTVVIYQSNPITIIGNAELLYILYDFYHNQVKLQYDKFDDDIISDYKLYNNMYYSELPNEIKLRFNHAKISVLKLYKNKNDKNNSLEKLIKQFYK